MMIEGIVTLIVFLISLAVSCAILYFVVKAAVAQGIKDALWNLEISMRNAVKNGALEARREIEKDKTGGTNG